MEWLAIVFLMIIGCIVAVYLEKTKDKSYDDITDEIEKSVENQANLDNQDK
jgi:predicted histidine transporter YuiF (NhaC family)